MKHNLKITIILLVMFLLTQFLGLLVINSYTPTTKQVLNETGQLQNVTIEKLPEGFQPPEGIKPMEFLPSIIISFIFAIGLMFLFMKFGLNRILRTWFFLVVIIALGLSLNALLSKFPALTSYLVQGAITYAFFFSLLIAVPLAIYKVFKRNLLVHNITELLIYPGIAAVLVPLFNTLGLIIILILISLYDMWAVWRSKIMIKMAKFQMNELKLFAGFYVPYLGKKERQDLDMIKQKYKTQQLQEKALKKKKIKVNLAILGGGDVVFPMIAAGVLLRAFGIWPAVLVIFGALAGLLFLFSISEKKKFYPAMPFITGGIFLAMLISWLIGII